MADSTELEALEAFLGSDGWRLFHQHLVDEWGPQGARFQQAYKAALTATHETEAALNRVRPLLMTTATTVIGLMPIFLTEGRGSDVMQPMAMPMVGGMAVQLVSFLLAPCLYSLLQERELRRRATATA